MLTYKQKRQAREAQQKRRDKLNEYAKALGYKSWSTFETAVINGKVTFFKRQQGVKQC